MEGLLGALLGGALGRGLGVDLNGFSGRFRGHFWGLFLVILRKFSIFWQILFNFVLFVLCFSLFSATLTYFNLFCTSLCWKGIEMRKKITGEVHVLWNFWHALSLCTSFELSSTPCLTCCHMLWHIGHALRLCILFGSFKQWTRFPFHAKTGSLGGVLP